MAKHQETAKPVSIGPVTAEDEEWIMQCLDTLWLERGASGHTLAAYERDMRRWACFLNGYDGKRLRDAVPSDAEIFLAIRQQQGYHPRSSARLLSALRRLYRWARLSNLMTHDPLAEVALPSVQPGLPDTLDEDEVDRLLGAPDVDTLIGLRDRTMLEVLYASGLRVSELVGLRTDSVSLRQGVVRVLGKGDKERLVPLGEEALDWLERYLKDARPGLVSNIAALPLFPGRGDGFMTRQTFWHRIKHYAQVACIDKPLSPHTLRHAFATHLLDHGAHLRVVQALLGHTDLSTTQIYTHVAQQRLEALHQQHHPRG